ncbi:hypothetical protein ACHAWO_013889 [Cyclotella atomus]|jgi:Sec-independent protein translocase protein TatA|uniref:Sec-independent protein translocase protein TatB n=1 Tax=Cyclotella atomus TaxID=382360 RepID=A0ABD3QNA7_9STRA
MLDVTLGELAILGGLGIVLIGRKDLPNASHALGRQVGRVVGLLQGARLRADRFATDHQLKQLQNEFRSGLRELDAVKAELAGAMTSTGRGMGAMVPGVDRRKVVSMKPAESAPLPMRSDVVQPQNLGADYLAAAQHAEASQSGVDQTSGADNLNYDLAPRSQAVAAVAEEEWEKQGIAFQSIAERGAFGSVDEIDSRGGSPSVGGGATILSNFMRQSLIHDQYERTIREQDEALRSRVDKVRSERESIKTENEETKS